jgi:hypothetical protein
VQHLVVDALAVTVEKFFSSEASIEVDPRMYGFAT